MAMTGGTAKLVHTGYPDYGSRTDKPVKLYVYYKSTQDQLNNKSTLSCGMYVTTPSGYAIGPWTDYNGSYVGTKSNTFTGTVSNFSGTKWLAENKTFTVEHNDEGEAEVTIYWKWGVNSPWGQFENESGSFKVKLPTIPRASTIGATDANIGSVSAITVNKMASAYTHSIAYKFGSLTGYINANGTVAASGTEPKFSATSVAFTVPTGFYSQIANAKNGVCTLTCTTYSGTTKVGTAKTCTFTVVAAESSCIPTVTGTVVDSNETTKALTGNSSVLVRYYSTALCTITATAKNSATISEKKIQGVTVSGNTHSISEMAADNVLFYAKDSRGYSNETKVTFSLIPYIKLTNNASAERTDPTSGNATLTMKGSYFNGSFGKTNNVLVVRYRVNEGSYVTITPNVGEDSYSATISLSGLDYTASHTIDVAVGDKLNSITKRLTIKPGIPVFDWGESDFSMNVLLLMAQGSVTNLSSSRYYSASDDTEASLEAWLNTQLRDMKDLSVKPVAWACHPAVTGSTVCSQLYRYSSTYAALFGFDINGAIYIKVKYNGSWRATVKHVIT